MEHGPDFTLLYEFHSQDAYAWKHSNMLTLVPNFRDAHSRYALRIHIVDVHAWKRTHKLNSDAIVCNFVFDWPGQ